MTQWRPWAIATTHRANDLITREHTQEALSEAYVTAIAAMAGLNLARDRHDYGIDGTFRTVKAIGSRRVPIGIGVDYQLKSTTNWTHEKGFVVYDLDARAHQVLTADREPGSNIAVLILLCLPSDFARWLDSKEGHLRLQHCCYWFLPEGPPTTSTSSTRIRVPRSNVLTPESLKEIMDLARARAVA